MRKSFYSLSGLVRTKMGKDPLDGSVYVFMNALNPLSAILHRRLGGGRSDCEDRHCGHTSQNFADSSKQRKVTLESYRNRYVSGRTLSEIHLPEEGRTSSRPPS